MLPPAHMRVRVESPATVPMARQYANTVLWMLLSGLGNLSCSHEILCTGQPESTTLLHRGIQACGVLCKGILLHFTLVIIKDVHT